MENNTEILQKIKNWSNIQSSNSTSEYTPKGNKSRMWKRHLHLHVYCSVIHSNQGVETTSAPISRWMGMVIYIYKCMKVKVPVAQSYSTLCNPTRLLCPWNSPGKKTSGLPFPFLGDLPDPGIELRSPTLQVHSLPSEPSGKPKHIYIYNIYIIYEILLSHEKEGNSPTCDNKDGFQGHYAKWDKSDRERQILYYLYVESKKYNKLVNMTKKKQI